MQNNMRKKTNNARKWAEGALSRMVQQGSQQTMQAPGMMPGATGAANLMGTAVERVPQDNMVQASGSPDMRAMLALASMADQEPTSATAVPSPQAAGTIDPELLRLLMARRQARGV